MKHHTTKQCAGVWLDNQQATIISRASASSIEDYSIREKVQASKAPAGGSEHSMSNAKRTEQLKYFKTLSNLLLPFDEILLFGPGQSQEQFQHHLEDDIAFKNKRITNHPSDQLTDPQRIAKVREFFKGRES